MGQSNAAMKLVAGAFWLCARIIGYSVAVTIILVYVYVQFRPQETPHGRPQLVEETTAGQSAARTLPGPDLQTAIPAVASAGTEPPQPPANASMMSVDSKRSVVWLSDYDGGKGGVYLRWDPAKGDARQIRLTADSLPGVSDLVPSTILDVRGGVMVLGLQRGSADQIVALLTPQNETSSAKLNVKREKPYLLELHDGSVLVISGIVGYVGNEKKFTNAVERISFNNDTVSVDQLPDIPGEIRRGISLVELSDGRVMALGGSWSPYVGNEPMTAETYFLDIATKTWETGPKMLEARTDATATLLLDGTVLVAGGWTPKNTWNDTPTRSTERWDRRSNGFVSGSPLPLGIAKHQAMWLPNRQGKQLLLVGGWVRAWNGNQTVLALDIDNGAWRTAGEQCEADGKTGELMVVPFEYNERAFMWCQMPRYSWNLVPLRLTSKGESSLDRIDPEKGIALHRHGMAFLPSNANYPGLAVGGTVDGADSAAVDAVWLDGRIQGLAPLNHARRHAQVFRLRDGSFLVAGGKGGDASRRTQHVPPLELLPAGAPLEQARWIDIDFDSKDIAAMGLLGDGSLLAVDSAGKVERLTIVVSQDKPTVQRSAFPSLNRRRGSSRENGYEITVSELPDGRIVVAGGWVQYHRIALLHEEAFRADAPDRFVGIGESTPAHWYEIYDPATKSWSESAPSSGTSNTAAVLDDGRVVKWGRIESADPWEQKSHESSSDHGKAALEISSTDGKAWGPLKAQAPPLVATDVIQRVPELFVIQGELFLFGMRPTDVTSDHWRGNAMVQWFNTSFARWETLWESGSNDNWYRDHIGRIIIRELPNGKHIALPVAGLTGNGSGG